LTDFLYVFVTIKTLEQGTGTVQKIRKVVSLKIRVKLVYRLQNIVITVQFINYCRLLQTPIT